MAFLVRTFSVRTFPVRTFLVAPGNFGHKNYVYDPLQLFSFVDESCRWLNSRGRVDESVKILRWIAVVNGKQVPEEVFLSFQVIGFALNGADLMKPICKEV